MQIHFQSIHSTADSKLKDYITIRLEKLEKFNDRIQNVKVTLKLENSGQVKDKITEIRLRIPVEVFISAESSKTFESSTDDAIDSLKRQIKRHKEKIQPKKRSR